jgi:hypothetical protein
MAQFKRWIFKTLTTTLAIITTQHGFSKSLTVHVGPPSIGAGGSNPVSIPPLNPIEYEVVYLTDSSREWTFGLVPGLLYGGRFQQGLFYFGLGGGLVFSINGGGPGMYSSIGGDVGDKIKFNFEIKQALGIDLGSNHLISPYAVRIGATFPL